MKILALETSEAIGTVAAFCDGDLLYEHTLNPDQRSAQSLTPGVKATLEKVGWQPADVELVAVTVGPGSFTGLRVGVTTAKTFAYSVGAAVLGLDTLEVIAARAPADVQQLSVAVDAQRGQVIAGLFQRDGDGHFVAPRPSELVNAKDWLESVPTGLPISGPVLRKLADRIPEGVTVLPADRWAPTASAVGLLAKHYHALGRRDDVWKLVPHYSRPSAAEEKTAVLKANRE